MITTEQFQTKQIGRLFYCSGYILIHGYTMLYYTLYIFLEFSRYLGIIIQEQGTPMKTHTICGGFSSRFLTLAREIRPKWWVHKLDFSESYDNLPSKMDTCKRALEVWRFIRFYKMMFEFWRWRRHFRGLKWSTCYCFPYWWWTQSVIPELGPFLGWLAWKHLLVAAKLLLVRIFIIH